MTAGLIVNPRSGKGSKKGLALAAKLAGEKNAVVRVLDEFGQLSGHIDDMAAGGVDTVFVSSGDGTVQAILTEIAERQPFTRLPALCLLPHGTTNMTAADLGLKIKNIDEQAAFIAATGRGEHKAKTRRRATVRIANPRDGKPRHGMFVGTGAVWQATLFTQTDVHKTGLKGDFATFATLVTVLAKAAFLPPRPDDKTRFDRPFPMKITAEGREIVNGAPLTFLVTTLKKLILGTRPFWGGASHPMRATVLPYPQPSVWRWTLPMMFGAEDRKAPPGSISFSAPDIEITTACPFVIDGEFFDPPQNGPLRIETGPQFTYVCGK